MSKKQPIKAIEIKISTVVAVSAILHDVDLDALDTAMQGITAGQPDYFENEPVVIDLGALDAGAAIGDWPALIALFKRHHLNAVAVRNAPADMEEQILAHGLGIDVVSKREERAAEAPAPIPAPVEARQPEPAPLAVMPAGTMIVDTPVRGGQRIYARGGDLVLMAAVNNGAEVIADGSIHVYAPLRGRALAGASGNAQARIFATSMEPELVSIAGVYKTFENGFPKEHARRAAQIRLKDDRLDIVPIELNTRKV